MMGERFASLLIAGVAIYFGAKGLDAASYNSRIGEALLDADNLITWLMGVLIWLGPLAARLAILGTILVACFADEAEHGGLTLLLWALCGWWLGKRFVEAAAEHQSCMSESFFGFGCMMDGPVLLGILYALLSLLLALAMAANVLGSIGGNDRPRESPTDT